MDVTKPYKNIGFGEIQARLAQPKSVHRALCSQAPPPLPAAPAAQALAPALAAPEVVPEPIAVGVAEARGGQDAPIGDSNGPKRYKFIWFGDIHGPTCYEFTWFW